MMETETSLTLTQQRAQVGLRCPSYGQKSLIWSRCSSPTAGISAKKGGYKPIHGFRLAHQADSRGVGISGGWRVGKSLGLAMEALAWLPFSQLIWLVGKDYD